VTGGRFGIGTFRRNLSHIAVKMILLLIYFKIYFINVVLSMWFAKVMPKQSVLLFNVKRLIPVDLDGPCCASSVTDTETF
jgi:hypothetical protein